MFESTLPWVPSQYSQVHEQVKDYLILYPKENHKELKQVSTGQMPLPAFA